MTNAFDRTPKIERRRVAGTFFHTLLWLVALIALSVALAGFFLEIVRYLVPIEHLRTFNDVAGNYLQTLGTVYAVLQAFVVYVVWGQFNETKVAVERESSTLADLQRIARGLPSIIRDTVISHLAAYVAAVVDEEWTLMARGGESALARRQLEKVWNGLLAMEPATTREELLLEHALNSFNELCDLRGHRLTCSRLRLPPSMWILVIGGGIVTVASMGFFGIDSSPAHLLMTSALAGLISFVIFIIMDLDNPFWGDWRVWPDAIRTALDAQDAS